MINSINRKKKRIGQELEEDVQAAQELAKELGLNPRPVKYWVVDNEEMNELIAYGGFQQRYPHWRWGMQYDRQQKKSEHGFGKAFEIVNNDDPCHAFLQMSNTTADQKAVITHVEAHSDFFENNQWFDDNPNASSMLAKNSERIEDIMERPSVSRSEVERWIDNILCLEDNIDQYSEYIWRDLAERNPDEDFDSEEAKKDAIDNLGLSETVKEAVFNDIGEATEGKELQKFPDDEKDILRYLIKHGKQYDESIESSREYEDWQLDILDILREEAYYFAPQKMTKFMNEGWAAIHEGWMMANENFADPDELITYADHQSAVLNSPGLNPYQLGKALWEHIENTVNRREVVDKLLRVDSIAPDNFHHDIDFQEVHNYLDKRDSDDLVERNYSLTRTQNQGFIQNISLDELRKSYRYIVNESRYETVEEALQDVDYGRGWDRMKEVRETHNDIMFIDEFMTQEFVDKHEYFTYEYRVAHQRAEIASRDVEDVKKKLLLQLTNFGKPTIKAVDSNYENAGELLLLHEYNGIVLNLEKAKKVMERLFQMWGRPVNLATVGHSVTENEMDYARSEEQEPEPDEMAVVFRYSEEDGFEEYEAPPAIEEALQYDDVDYDTKPDEWKV
jgi:stage V sporulation protein R